MRESFVTAVPPVEMLKDKDDAVRDHPRTRRTRDGALIDGVLSESRRRFAFRESWLRRPYLYRGKIDTTPVVTRLLTNRSQ
jgi:hypothetical protein